MVKALINRFGWFQCSGFSLCWTNQFSHIEDVKKRFNCKECISYKDSNRIRIKDLRKNNLSTLSPFRGNPKITSDTQELYNLIMNENPELKTGIDIARIIEKAKRRISTQKCRNKTVV